MKDDVVTLMRANAALCEPEFESAFLKAADEIERLRALLGEYWEESRRYIYDCEAARRVQVIERFTSRIDKELGND